MARPTINRVGSAIIAVGIVAFLISALSYTFYVSANPFVYFNLPALTIDLVHPTVELALCFGACLKRSILLRSLFLLVSSITIPLLLDRHGGGVTDVSEVVRVRVAEYVYSAALLMDISTVLWVACAVSALVLLPKRRSNALAIDKLIDANDVQRRWKGTP